MLAEKAVLDERKRSLTGPQVPSPVWQLLRRQPQAELRDEQAKAGPDCVQ